MKLLTVVGTRPEYIRLALTLPRLDQEVDQVILDTCQSYDDSLRGVFYRELGLRKPDIELNVRGDFAEQTAAISIGVDQAIRDHVPTRFFALGDTNSTLIASIIARRAGLQVIHAEGGNRCGDWRSPEETNRKVLDHLSTASLCYTERARINLVREGIDPATTWVTGNPIGQVIRHFQKRCRPIEQIGEKRGWPSLAPKRYLLATAHRAENVDYPDRLNAILAGLRGAGCALECPVIFSVHPRTKKRLAEFGLESKMDGLTLTEPLGFIDFLSLQRNALAIVSDSGTVAEESLILGVPAAIIRRSTERPEAVEAAGNRIVDVDPETIIAACSRPQLIPTPEPPEEYLRPHVNEAMVNVIVGNLL